MITVRRLYVYLISGISLFVLGMGLTNLLGLAFGQVWENISGAEVLLTDGSETRREVSLNLALIAVALPIWILHWYLAERWVRRDDEESDRHSTIRALYLAAVLAVTLVIVATANLFTLVATLLSWISGVSNWNTDRDVAYALAGTLVLGAIWIFHALIRRRDTRQGPLDGPADWFVRLYQYLAALIGGVMLLIGASSIIGTIMREFADGQEIIAGENIFGRSLINDVTLILVGGFIWAAHWGYSLSVYHADDWRGDDERRALLRRTYLYLAVFVGVAMTLIFTIMSLTDVLRLAFGVEVGTSNNPAWSRILEPLLQAVPYVIFWLYHRWVLLSEAVAPEAAAEGQVGERLYSYVVAFLALAFTAGGLAWLLGVLIEFFFERAAILNTDPEWVPDQVSQFLSIALVGAIVWGWHWFAAQRRLADDPAGERVATSRRVYLYLVLTGATLALLVSLAIVLYQGLQVLLDVRELGGLASEIGVLLGIVIISTMLLVYHLLILREDLQFADTQVAETEPAVSTVYATLPLNLTGPEGVDLETVVSRLQQHLPRGVQLNVDPYRPKITHWTDVDTEPEAPDEPPPDDVTEDVIEPKNDDRS